jgi:hypothetical protein
MEDEWEV